MYSMGGLFLLFHPLVEFSGKGGPNRSRFWCPQEEVGWLEYKKNLTTIQQPSQSVGETSDGKMAVLPSSFDS